MGVFIEVRNQDHFALEPTRLPVYLIRERPIVRPFRPTFALLLFLRRFLLGLPDFFSSGTVLGLNRHPSTALACSNLR